MTCAEKVVELRQKIETALTPLITRDYWLLEVPYYNNIGDTLIWQGEMDFLRRLPCKCKGMCSLEASSLPKIGKNDLILFQGGGNFGDVWQGWSHDYRKKVMRNFPHNHYVVFPQTVWYDDMQKCLEDARMFADYDMTICARDCRSYDFLKENFRNKILLVPDMAFRMDMCRWNKPTHSTRKPLILKRIDKEFKDSSVFADYLERVDADVEDWPTMCGPTSNVERWRQRIRCHPRKLGWLYNPYMYYIYRLWLIRSGVKLINSHTDIYTTRLHTCILSVLLGKEKIVFFDNSYGKNSCFYQTWLSDCDSVWMAK